MRRNRADLFCILLLVVAAAFYPHTPALLWLFPVFITLWYLGRRVARLPRRELLWIGGAVAVSLLIQLVTLAIWGYRNPLTSMPRVDDYSYVMYSRAIAHAWETGWYPRLSLKGSPPYLGTLHTGYERVLASLYLLFGPRLWLGFALNVVCAALMPLLGYLLARGLFSSDECPQSPAGGLISWLRRPDGDIASLHVARLAAIITAVHPVFPFWTRWMYRDLVLGFVFMVAVILAVDVLRRPRVLAGLLFACVLMYVTITRQYAGLGLVAGLALYGFALIPRRLALWGIAYAVLAVLFLSFTETGSRYISQLIASILNLVPMEAATLPGSLKYFGTGIPRLLFAPYGWVRATVANPDYGMYPGMWMLYLLIYPAAIVGIVWAMRVNHLLSLPGLGALLTTAILVLMAYEGDMTRRRMWLEPLLIVYAAGGLSQARRWPYFTVWYVLLAFAAGAQLASLVLRG